MNISYLLCLDCLSIPCKTRYALMRLVEFIVESRTEWKQHYAGDAICA